jgi:diguanylate cyclase (GGDEF)-like protein
LEELYSYLKTYQAKYDYTTVFCISAKTGNYYYQDGFNKTLSRNDEHDIWYYNFLDSNYEYDLEVDTNQASDNSITIFVNFRVECSDGKLLGVIGVGLKMSFIEDTIRSYEQDYGLSVYIINVGGAENSFVGNTDIFINEEELSERIGIQDKIVMKKSESSEMQWFTSSGERKCLITKYNNTLRWHLVLEMETNSISSSFQERIKSNIFYMLISLAACILVTTIVFNNYNQRILTTENMDELTGLSNKKLFARQYLEFVRKHRKQKKTLFMLDIDNFKNANDKYGHMYGNAILSKVGDLLRSTVNGHGIAARWGGDEFLGILAVEPAEAERILNQFMDTLKNIEMEGNSCITVSIGIMEINEKLHIDQMIKKVDEAMYTSKENGRNRITICGISC